MDVNSISLEEIKRLVPENIIKRYRDNTSGKFFYLTTDFPIQCARALLETRLELETLKKENLRLKELLDERKL